ncbi:M48 family metallopeptidase [Rhizobacter sp. OV335]|uniref:M48 family metallopeptidase n=1 Tax=Rhizobacter sp. OV335 TaxID=1500264 RepID=UPI000920B6F4|nr:M48 family metallopeptidase [Rhizobacter sp. OV335]SHL92644.1 Zn-dependent protease with chaperone function [Rhizobacter sp. OV335]
MSSPIKAPPAKLVAKLARPSAAYKRHAWLAVAALAAFMLLYLGLAGWFLFTAWRLTLGTESSSGSAVWGWVIGGCAAFLAVFMLKAIFFVKQGSQDNTLEITAAEQPRLFEFLHKLADRAGAPRPHKVFLSARVNAAVFYDLSVLNLVMPSRKNLEIGLGLVNAVTLGEMRAVLAHEFGHFAQRSMAVGRWVYVAQQIAGHLVARRDKLDAFLKGLSRFDIRIAWVGWVLGVIVWAIRSLVDSAFSAVLLVQRALSREMEMQADLVAVSLTGSDALIHALHKLQAADDSWDRTLGFIGSEHARERVTRDAFAIQSRVMQRMGQVLNDPQYHRVPALPADKPQQHRLFKAEVAQPPRMWLTHPLNHEREANAKRHYVAAPFDDRSAWALFDDAPGLRERVTAQLIGETKLAPLPIEDSLQALDEQFARESLQGRYRGVYLGRSVTRSVKRAAELVDPALQRATPSGLAALYPESLLDDVARLRELALELAQLRALKSGALKAPGGVIRHRDRTLKHGELPGLLKTVEREHRQVEQRLLAHDKACRSTHRAAAAQLGGGWDSYLDGLLALLHYADHSEANLRDAQGLLSNAWQVESATRRVGKAGVARLVIVANQLQSALQRVSDQRDALLLDSTLRDKLGVASWSELLGEFKLPPTTGDNLGDWLGVVDSWVDQLAGACGRLRSQALDQLLRTEALVARRARGEAVPELAAAAPEPSRAPTNYDTLLAGRERERQTRLGWLARFQTADGALPMLARLGVAGGIIAAVLGLGGSVGDAQIVVYNGLGTPVQVTVAGRPPLAVAPNALQRITLPAGHLVQVESRTPKGALIESFEADAKGSFGTYVYNVASAAPLVEWTAVYGRTQRIPERMLGTPRWSSTGAEHVFEEPPKTISTKGGGGTRTVLQGLADLSPERQLNALANDAQRRQLIATHLRWDASGSAPALQWLGMVGDDAQLLALLRERLKATPDDVAALRAEQDGTRAGAHAEVCARHVAASRAAPDNPNLRYAAVRCETESPQKWQAFIDGHARWPAHAWFGYAAAYSELDFGRLDAGLAGLGEARARLAPLAEHIAIDEARLRRFLKQDDAKHMAELTRVSPMLQTRLAMESGTSTAEEPLPTEYAELARGRFDAAIKAAATGSAHRQARLLRLAAASDGADQQLVIRAIALPLDSGVDDATAWLAAAVAARGGQDIESFIAVVARRSPTDAALMRVFFEQLQKTRDVGVADRVLAEVSFQWRMQAYAAGVVLLGREAPAAWRDAARKLLFADERPYFMESASPRG